MGINASAPGKIIISGEHSVVYGYPAIATTVDRHITIHESGRIESNIPIGAGMGSSAAFAVAMSALTVGRLDLEKINSIAYGMEKKKHGNPSGVDNTVSTYGGFLWYRKESEQLKIFSRFTPKVKVPGLFLINTGRPEESTKEMVGYVAEAYKIKKNYVNGIFIEMESVTRGFLKVLMNEQKGGFGELVWENEKLLERLGVVSDGTKRIIRNIEKIGGSAKITGAGGRRRGSGMVLVYHKDRQKLQKFLKSYKLDVFDVELGVKGVNLYGKGN